MQISFSKHFGGGWEGEALGWPSRFLAGRSPPPPLTTSLGLVPVYSCDCLQGKQRALHASISDSSGLHSFRALPGREHTWGSSFSLEKRLRGPCERESGWDLMGKVFLCPMPHPIQGSGSRWHFCSRLAPASPLLTCGCVPTGTMGALVWLCLAIHRDKQV